MTPLTLTLTLGVALAADVVGFRGSGQASFPDARLPASWDPGSCWSAPAPAWSNSSPLVVGELVCAMAEPTTLFCVDRRTGAPRWQATNDYVDTLPAAERPAWSTRLAEAEARATRAVEVQRSFSQLRRTLRSRPDDTALQAEADRLGRELAGLRAATEADAAYLTPPDKEIIGYTTHSPVSDGQRIYTQTGHGVVSAFALDGRRVWSVWLGPAPRTMRGYHLGSSASPVLADGRLVVGHGTLRALDAATGRTLWTSVPFQDYGSPAAARIGSTWVLATNAGEVVRLSDGKVLAQGLASPWYTGPVIVNGTAWWVGANASHNVRPSDPAWAIGMTLAEVGPGEVRATPRVRTAIPTQEPMYVSPAVLGDDLFTVDVGGGVWRVDTGTGAVTAHGTVQVGPVYPSPLAIGGRLLVGGESGTFVVIDPRAPATPLSTHTLPRTRATPAPAGGALFVRTLDGLLCVGSPR